MTNEAAVQTLERTELDRLRELVRRIEAEEEPAQLELLFQKLRTLVGLTEEEIVSEEASFEKTVHEESVPEQTASEIPVREDSVPEQAVSTILVQSPQPAE